MGNIPLRTVTLALDDLEKTSEALQTVADTLRRSAATEDAKPVGKRNALKASRMRGRAAVYERVRREIDKAVRQPTFVSSIHDPEEAAG